MAPLAIDLFCGLGGWTEGLLAEGYRVVGFDVERHRYPARVVPEGDGTKARISGVDFGASSIGLPTHQRSYKWEREEHVRCGRGLRKPDLRRTPGQKRGKRDVDRRESRIDGAEQTKKVAAALPYLSF